MPEQRPSIQMVVMHLSRTYLECIPALIMHLYSDSSIYIVSGNGSEVSKKSIVACTTRSEHVLRPSIQMLQVFYSSKTRS
jgi:hypothetical protein